MYRAFSRLVRAFASMRSARRYQTSATYALANRLDTNRWPGAGANQITNPFAIPFTGYIDAIAFGLWGDAETRRPPSSAFHCAQYQQTVTAHPEEWVWGAPSDGNDDWNRTDLGVTHYTIDDNTVVLDFLQMRLRQKVTP